MEAAVLTQPQQEGARVSWAAGDLGENACVDGGEPANSATFRCRRPPLSTARVHRYHGWGGGWVLVVWLVYRVNPLLIHVRGKDLPDGRR